MRHRVKLKHIRPWTCHNPAVRKGFLETAGSRLTGSDLLHTQHGLTSWSYALKLLVAGHFKIIAWFYTREYTWHKMQHTHHWPTALRTALSVYIGNIRYAHHQYGMHFTALAPQNKWSPSSGPRVLTQFIPGARSLILSPSLFCSPSLPLAPPTGRG